MRAFGDHRAPKEVCCADARKIGYAPLDRAVPATAPLSCASIYSLNRVQTRAMPTQRWNPSQPWTNSISWWEHWASLGTKRQPAREDVKGLDADEHASYRKAFAAYTEPASSYANEASLPECVDVPGACALLPWRSKKSPCTKLWVMEACKKTCGACVAPHPPLNPVSTRQKPLACGLRSGEFLLEGACVLAASSISSRDESIASHVAQAVALCELGYVHSFLNLFDENPRLQYVKRLLGERWWVAAEGGRVKLSTHRGFKTIFWKHELTSDVVAAYTHVFLHDADLLVHPKHFALSRLLRVQAKMKVPIIQPAPWGPKAGLFAATAPRSKKAGPNLCGPPPPAPPPGVFDWPAPRADERCAACRSHFIEIKAPLFITSAWQIFHQVLLSRIPDAQLTCDFVSRLGRRLDHVWCTLVEHYRGLCSCRWCSARNKTYALEAGCGSTCAVSYATPVYHSNTETILRSLNASKRALSREEAQYKGYKTCIRLLHDSSNFGTYHQQPSWRGNGLVRTDPCWSGGQLAKALDIV